MEKFNLYLNPKKFTFAMKTEKFLGFLMTKKGIEQNPEKVKVITDMKPPKLIKDVQKLTGRLAVLSWFLSKFAKISLTFFQVLKKVEA